MMDPVAEVTLAVGLVTLVYSMFRSALKKVNELSERIVAIETAHKSHAVEDDRRFLDIDKKLDRIDDKLTRLLARSDHKHP